MKKFRCINAFTLKILAMALMLCDHLWATILPYEQWLTNIGRLAFPIFAFQIVEGCFHTRDLKAYRRRLFLFALVSEIPFNLMTAGGLINPFHQNVMFSFWLSLLLIGFLQKMEKKGGLLYWGAVILSLAGGYVLGTITFVDYYGYGILMVLTFYLLRNVPRGWVGILLSMLIINWGMMGGLTYPVNLLGFQIDFPQQAFALLALIPISMYNGKQGPHSKALQYGAYLFYPAHMLILALIWLSMV